MPVPYRLAAGILDAVMPHAPLADVTYTFWYDLCLLHARLADHLPARDAELRRAARALRGAKRAVRMRRGRHSMRRLAASRAALLRAARTLPHRSPVRAEVLGHLEGLPQVWGAVASRWEVN